MSSEKIPPAGLGASVCSLQSTLRAVLFCIGFYQPFITFSAHFFISASEALLSIIPSAHLAPLAQGARSSAVLPRPLPPEVAKSAIVLPEKS